MTDSQPKEMELKEKPPSDYSRKKVKKAIARASINSTLRKTKLKARSKPKVSNENKISALYKLLQVEPGCTEESLKMAYKKRMADYDTEFLKKDTLKRSKVQKIRQAFQILSSESNTKFFLKFGMDVFTSVQKELSRITEDYKVKINELRDENKQLKHSNPSTAMDAPDKANFASVELQYQTKKIETAYKTKKHEMKEIEEKIAEKHQTIEHLDQVIAARGATKTRYEKQIETLKKEVLDLKAEVLELKNEAQEQRKTIKRVELVKKRKDDPKPEHSTMLGELLTYSEMRQLRKC